MPRKNPTSVTLSDFTQKIKDELTPIYGLKNSLSAGLMLFNFLPPDSREKIVSLVNQLPPSADPGKQDNDFDENMIRTKIIRILRAAAEIEPKKPVSSRAKSSKNR